MGLYNLSGCNGQAGILKQGEIMSNLDLWNSWKQPPKTALKEFNNGRYKGTDISPQWRYQVLTEKFGAIGIGWYYTIDKQWTEQGAEGVIMAMANISLYVKSENEWSKPIQGTGGNQLVSKTKNYMMTSDEGYKMAVTDAISVACKMLGIGADIYLGNFDGSKYRDEYRPKMSEAKQTFKGLYNPSMVEMEIVYKGEKKTIGYINANLMKAPDDAVKLAIDAMMRGGQ